MEAWSWGGSEGRRGGEGKREEERGNSEGEIERD